MGIDLLMVKPEDDTIWRQCEQVEYEVFKEQGYVSSNSTQRIFEFDRYKNCLFIAAVLSRDEYPPSSKNITGVMRFIYEKDESKMKKGLFPTIDSSNDLKISTEKHDMLMSIDPRDCIDLSSVAIRRQYRASDTSMMFMEFCMKHEPNIQYILAALDSRIYQVIKRYLLIMQTLGPPVYYWGSMTTAVLIDRYFQFQESR